MMDRYLALFFLLVYMKNIVKITLILFISFFSLLISALISELRCPLSGKIMHVPMIAPDGYTYDKESLLNYRKMYGDISSTTGNAMNYDEIHANNRVKILVDKFKNAHPEYMTDAEKREMEKGFQLFVRTVQGKMIAINGVNNKITILELKKKVMDKDGTPENQQRLIFGGKQLEDHYDTNALWP
ncbi:hypothetical protein TRFO_19297 [Tritrichomonas foetus]|uniref:Ubiquitin-like domain-containing protein n=1 Tax=Tritrichomonas foetus TaxID=1144522 RepID=A0A1J4KJN6_9EUKA|nr:hypothetical protein TRFO_19297 [Tritrichomonas foetus]|eukprot:OHT11314.1 hypothetical protein TRFO_19297 [Tritrichomonas foetus]